MTNSIGIGANVVVSANNTVVIGDNAMRDFQMFGVSMMKAKPASSTYFFGSAGNTTTNASAYIGIGQSALASMPFEAVPENVPSLVIAIGHQAMQNSLKPGASVAIGAYALQNFGTTAGQIAIDTVAVGNDTFRAATSGVGGTAIGHFALQNVISIGGNTGIGDSALRFTTTGQFTTALGYTAADANISGNENVDLGMAAGRARTNGNGNVTAGFSAGSLATGGNNNVLIGRLAANIYSGDEAVAVGAYALGGATGIRNVGIGYGAGGSITSGTLNSFLGFAAGQNVGQKADAVNSMALGNSTWTTKSNQVVIGNSVVDEVVLAGVAFTKAQLMALRALVP